MEYQGSHFRNAPYARKEGRKSIFSKIKDSVKDIFSPSWISELVHGAKKESPAMIEWDLKSEFVKSANGGIDPIGYQKTDNTPFQNPSQAFVNGLPRNMDILRTDMAKDPGGMVPFQASVFNPSAPPASLPVFTSAQLPLSRITEKSDRAMTHEDSLSELSDVSRSTSGCSSTSPRTAEQSKRVVASEKRKIADDVDLLEDTIICSSQELPLSKRPKMHFEENISFSKPMGDGSMQKPPSPAVVSNRPSFNASLFGSPLNNESTLLGTSFHESSFYPGKTTYGGRSSMTYRSQKKTDFNQSHPSRLLLPAKAFMKAKPRQNVTKEAVTSSTARRIMEVLDKIQTPLNDTKMIPLIMPQHWTGSPSVRERKSPRSGPTTPKLTIGSQATVTKNQQVNFLGLQSTTQLMKPLPVRQDTVLLSNESGLSGKMKRDKSYHKGSASIRPALQEGDDTVVLPDLQTKFVLPVTKMPTFNFVDSPTRLVTNNCNTPTTRPRVMDSGSEHNFTFSSPTVETVPKNKPASPPQPPGDFQFSSPINMDSKDASKPILTALSTTEHISASLQPVNMGLTFSSSTAAKSTVSGPTAGTINSGSLRPSTEVKQWGVCFQAQSAGSGVCTSGIGVVPTSEAPDLRLVFKSTGWICSVCLLNNKDNDQKCMACQTVRPEQNQKGPTSNASVGSVATTQPMLFGQAAGMQIMNGSGLGALFKTSEWTCETCLLNNKMNAEKCIACQTVKSNGQKPNATESLSVNNSEKSDILFAKFMPPVGQWECEVCLVQNQPDTNTCLACQTPKPLKVFKPTPGDWVCDTCLVNNKAANVNCVACGFARPGPSRTQAVPSDMKKCPISHGSEDPDMVDTSKASKITISSAGGFVFKNGDSAADSTKTSSFRFGSSDSIERSSKLPDFKTPGGGFKFSSSTHTTNATDFKFGANVVSETNNANKSVVGTLKFSDVQSSPAEFRFNSGSLLSKSRTDSEENHSSAVDFQFGRSDYATLKKNSEPESSVVTGCTSFPSSIFSQKSESSSKESKGPLQTTVSLPDGFTSKQSGSITSVNNDISSTVTNSLKSTGGFNFSTIKSSSSLLPAVTSVGGSMFTATKITESSSMQASSTSAPFSLNLKHAGAPASNSAFAFGAPSSTTSNSNCSFGQSFSAMASSAEVTRPVFGQMNTSNNSSSVFQFGQTNTAAMVNFSAVSSTQKSETSSAGMNNPMFKFGQQLTKPAAGNTPTFGITGGFGSGIGSVFGSGIPLGGNAPSTTLVVGSAPPAFGSASSTTPDFGVAVFGLKSNNAAAVHTQSNTVYEFGKPTDQTQTTGPTGGFNFSASTGPITAPSFNFTAQTPSSVPTLTAPGSHAFSATSGRDGRKIMKAVRKIRR